MDKSTAITVLGALAQDTRLDIFRHLTQTGPQPAGQVGECFSLPLATLSFHLKTLQQAGLLDCRRNGRQLIYQARGETVTALMTYLVEHCCQPSEFIPATAIPPKITPQESTVMSQEKVYNVLFLCTANSARSILAEAIMNHLSNGQFRAYSAGSFPAGAVNPYALKLLTLQGVSTEGLRSKSWSEFAAPGVPVLDFVFTVCDNAAKEVCPIWPGQPMSAHWGVVDPAAQQGDEAQKMIAFRTALRELGNRIKIFMNLPIRSLDKIKLQGKLDEIGKTMADG